jgi:hypothetical protein
MKQPGDQRHCDENSEISRKHGNTLIATLPRPTASISHLTSKATKKWKTRCAAHPATSLHSANWLMIFTADGGGRFQV